MFDNNQRKLDRWKYKLYPLHWNYNSYRYGLDIYCAGQLKLISSYNPRSVFELGIGNGFPFAESLSAKGVVIAGCDISKYLIDELMRRCPAVNACVCGYENADIAQRSFPDLYDVVYCLRSFWYFSDAALAIDFMLRLVKPGGVIIFDIMNLDSSLNRKMLLRKNLSFPLTIVKNCIKKVFNWFIPNRYLVDKIFGVVEIMHSAFAITNILNERKLKYTILSRSEIENGSSVELLNDQKITFVVSKNVNFD